MAIKKPQIKGLEELGVEPNREEKVQQMPSLKEVIDGVKYGYKEAGIEGTNIILGMLISMNDKNISTFNVFYTQLEQLKAQVEELKNQLKVQQPKSTLITSLH